MKKLLISVLSALVVLFSFVPYFSVAKAQNDGGQTVGQNDRGQTPGQDDQQTSTTQETSQGVWYNQSPAEWYSKVYDTNNPNEIFGERYTAAQVQWIVYSIPSMFINWMTNGNADLGSCLMGIVGGSPDIQLCVRGMTSAVNDLTNSLGINPTGIVAETPSIASQIFEDRPISGIGYVKNLVSKFNPVTTVQAQTNGFGYKILTSLRPLWKITRDASFFLFIIIAVVFAFMIMFRIKLSPQTVISVQSALPKVIITLILVTFSYAIAGLLVDLMYILMGLISTLLAPLLGDSPKFIFGFINGTWPIVRDSGLSLILYFVIYLITYFFATIVALIAATVGLHLSSIIFSLILLIFTLVLLLILVWYILKTIYVLFKNLAVVYGLIIIAPLQITAGALFPQMGFGSWAKKLFAKLMVFPLTGVFIYIALALLLNSMWFSLQGAAQNNVIFSGVWNDVIVNGILKLFTFNSSNFQIGQNFQIVGLWGPPMLGNPAAASGIAFLLMSLGIIMMIPKISDAIDGFMAGKGFAGSGIGEAMGPFGGLAKTAGGAAMGMAEREFAGPASIAAANAAMKRLKLDPSRGVGHLLDEYVKSKSQDKNNPSPVRGPGVRQRG